MNRKKIGRSGHSLLMQPLRCTPALWSSPCSRDGCLPCAGDVPRTRQTDFRKVLVSMGWCRSRRLRAASPSDRPVPCAEYLVAQKHTQGEGLVNAFSRNAASGSVNPARRYRSRNAPGNWPTSDARTRPHPSRPTPRRGSPGPRRPDHRHRAPAPCPHPRPRRQPRRRRTSRADGPGRTAPAAAALRHRTRTPRPGLDPAERGPYPLLHADALNVLAQLERDQGRREAAVAAATEAYRQAWCDGPPYAYHFGLTNARRHLQELGAAGRCCRPSMPPNTSQCRKSSLTRKTSFTCD